MKARLYSYKLYDRGREALVMALDLPPAAVGCVNGA